MKLTIERNDLNATLAKVTAIVERKNTIPILANVMIKASGDSVVFVATDLDIEVTASCAASVTTQGSVTVNAAMLAEIAKKSPSGALIEFDGDGDTLSIKAGKSKFKLATLPAADFPVMASNEYTSEFTIPAIEFARLMGKPKFAISTEETRYYLNGVYLHTVDGKLRTVATDGHKLAQVDFEYGATIPDVIVPRKTVMELVKTSIEGDVTVSVSDTKIKSVMDGLTIVSKVIDGTFPDYTRVIPQSNKNKMTIDAKAFAAASDRVALVSDDRARAVKLALSDGLVTLSVTGANGSNANEEVDCDYSGEPIELGFNSKYLAEILSNTGGTVTFEFGGSGDPAIVRTDEDDGFLAVVMPMRV